MSEKKTSVIGSLSDGDLSTLVSWGKSREFQLLMDILDKYGMQHLKILIQNPITQEKLLEISERRGRFMEGKYISRLPEMAANEIKLRKSKDGRN